MQEPSPNPEEPSPTLEAGDTEISRVPAAPQPLTEAAKPPLPQPKRAGWRMLVAPTWFLLGVLVGLIAFASYSQLTTRPTAPAWDMATLKNAAREGVLEAIATLQAQSAQAQQSRDATPAPVTKDAFAIREANRLGDAQAKVTIVEYADFQCPFCGRFHRDLAPVLYEQYIKTGKASLVYKHLAFLGDESWYSAMAAECAADQGKFWEYHNLLFERQSGENQGAFTKDKLLAFGKELALDMTKFEPCLTNDATLERVRADTIEGQQFGVNSTPTFFINGKPLVGLQPLEEFKAALEQALSE